MMDMIVIGPCWCGGYGQVFNRAAKRETGVCHRGIGSDLYGHVVTAKLKGEDECRQGVVVCNSPLILRGKLGYYECEGTPTVIDPLRREGEG